VVFIFIVPMNTWEEELRKWTLFFKFDVIILCKKERNRKKKKKHSQYSPLLTTIQAKVCHFESQALVAETMGVWVWGDFAGKTRRLLRDSLFAHLTLTVWQRGLLMVFSTYLCSVFVYI
jgi:hypothetical protein